MRLTVTHNKSQAEAIERLDQEADGLFSGAAGPSVEIADQTKEWVGPVMHFSFTAKLGFIAVPLKGSIEVADRLAVVDCELPPLVGQFLGEDKVGGVIEKKMTLLLE